MPTHSVTTIVDLQTLIRKFRDERDWMQFHNHKDMAAALAIEAAELQELFLWKHGKQIDEIAASKRDRLSDELADVAVYLLELADNLGIDLGEAVVRKLEKNAAKYPVHKAKGSSLKYDEF